MPDDPFAQSAALAYVSDWGINFASCGGHVPAPRKAGRRLYVASLNHAIWLLRPARADEWMFFDRMSPISGDGRGFSVTRAFDGAGRLIANATQDCLMALVDA